MQRLLIVDDMPIIADGLVDLFVEHNELDLEIFRAYSAFEALDILRRLKIDVVLTDIKMPGMSGIDLLKEIRGQWQRCKVIFLTSYDDFNYAREAMSLGGFEYVLKTEGDEYIVNTVLKALEAIQSELEAEVWTSNAREQYKQAKPVLQKEYLIELLEGRRPLAELRSERLKQLEIPLLSDIPVYLILMRLDTVKDNINYSGLIRRFYSAQNIMEDYIQSRVKFFPISYSHSQHIWLLQPEGLKSCGGDDWENIFHFIYGNLETVQSVCASLFKLKVSFVVSSNPIEWERLADKYLQMEILFKSGIGLNTEILTTDDELQKNNARQSLYWDELETTRKGFRINRFYNLAESLNNGQEHEFWELYSELNEIIKEFDGNIDVELEVYHYLSSVFLSYMNRWKMFKEVKEKINTSKLTCFDEKIHWTEYMSYFKELASILFEFRAVEREQQTNKLVMKIQKYIMNHLNSDLSLTLLGEHVHLNPSYLSRLYKQLTGTGLSDYIAEQRIYKAKKLLREGELKIHEISTAVGYNSSIAFTRFFKKIIGIPPQDYRDNTHDQHN